MMRTRAYENRCFILSVNQVNFGGGSALFGPQGDVLAQASRKEQILHCSVNLGQLKARPPKLFELLKTRRPETYLNLRG